MLALDSRKKNIPARLREEMWYLVKYEDDENLRVLYEDCHIFEDQADDEMAIGNIVSALWLPDGKYYDAKVLEKGTDKNELMKERLKHERKQAGKKTTDEEASGSNMQKKRKNVKSHDNEKSKAKKVSDEEKENKSKKKEGTRTRKTKNVTGNKKSTSGHSLDNRATDRV